jgi:AraC-like DNA-binding protein
MPFGQNRVGYPRRSDANGSLQYALRAQIVLHVSLVSASSCGWAVIFETCHDRFTTLRFHRRSAYAALVLDGGHREVCVEGAFLCEPGTLILRPSYQAHGNRFCAQGARLLNLPMAGTTASLSVLQVQSLHDAKEVIEKAPQYLGDIAATSKPIGASVIDGGGWQAALFSALIESAESVASITQRLGISAEHACRTMVARHGVSPVQLRQEARWHRALHLLRAGLSLGEVAVAAGFADQSHFARFCRAQTGLTPVRLRAHLQFG